MDEKRNDVPKNSPYCRQVILVSVLASGFSLGYSFTCLNPLVEVIEDMFNSTYYERNGLPPTPALLTTLVSLTVSMPIVGGFFGSISVSHILRILTRKQAMILLNCLVIIGNIIVTAGAGPTGSYEAFIIGRFINGLGLGIAINIFPVVIAELCARQYQQKFQSTTGLSLSIGAVLGPVISHPKVLGGDRWPWVIAFGCISPLVYLYYSLRCPETPYTLLRRSKREEALKVLRKLRIGTQESIDDELAQIEREQSGFCVAKTKENVDGGSSETIKYLGIKAILRTRRYRHQFLLAVMLYCGLMFTGSNHVVLYSDEIFKSAGIPSDIVTYATIGVFALQALTSLAGVKLIAIYGGRRLVLVTLSFCIIAHIMTTIGLVTSEFSANSGYVSVIGVLVFLMSYSCGPNIAVFALAAEITIEPTRQTVLNYVGGLVWASGWIVGFFARYMDASMHGFSFLVWCGCTVVVWLLIFWLVPETKGRTMEEIQRDL